MGTRIRGSALYSPPCPAESAATPTVIVMRDDHQHLRGWSERPSELQAWFIERQAILRRAELVENKQKWYSEDAGKKTIEEIVALMEGAAAR